MINFRFHLASLIAIFLALALGVVIGAGVIDRGVVDALDTRLDKVQARTDRIQSENDALRDAGSQRDRAIDGLSKQALGGKLQNEDVGVVAVRGVDGDQVDNTTAALRTAGANVTGVLWLEAPWKLENAQEVDALAQVIGSSARRPATLRTQAWQHLATRLAQSPVAVAASSDDLLAQLDDAGFVSFDAPSAGGDVGKFPGANASIVLVVGSEGRVPSDEVVVPASSAMVAEKVELVASDIYVADAPGAGSRGTAFDDLRDSALSTTVSTVDDLEMPWGPGTVVLALDGVLRNPPVVGHYGLGPETVLMPDPVTAS